MPSGWPGGGTATDTRLGLFAPEARLSLPLSLQSGAGLQAMLRSGASVAVTSVAMAMERYSAPEGPWTAGGGYGEAGSGEIGEIFSQVEGGEGRGRGRREAWGGNGKGSEFAGPHESPK